MQKRAQLQESLLKIILFRISAQSHSKSATKKGSSYSNKMERNSACYSHFPCQTQKIRTELVYGVGGGGVLVS